MKWNDETQKKHNEWQDKILNTSDKLEVILILKEWYESEFDYDEYNSLPDDDSRHEFEDYYNWSFLETFTWLDITNGYLGHNQAMIDHLEDVLGDEFDLIEILYGNLELEIEPTY